MGNELIIPFYDYDTQNADTLIGTANADPLIGGAGNGVLKDSQAMNDNYCEQVA